MSICRRLFSTASPAKNTGAANTPQPARASPDRTEENQTLTLSDGRVLGFAEYGSPQGKPLLFFHGLPSCRYEGGFDELGLRYNARVLSIDRPGMELSTFQPDRNLLDWPADVQEFARKLALDEYRVLGGSRSPARKQYLKANSKASVYSPVLRQPKLEQRGCFLPSGSTGRSGLDSPGWLGCIVIG